MAEFIDAHGNLLKADVEALVNSVNTVGVMGKGIALQFKNAFPANFKAYEAACKKQAVRLGEVFVFDNGQLTPPRWIINFPTKGHWRARSRIRDVADGLDNLRFQVGPGRHPRPSQRITRSPSASSACSNWSRVTNPPTDSNYSPAFTGWRPARGTSMI